MRSQRRRIATTISELVRPLASAVVHAEDGYCGVLHAVGDNELRVRDDQFARACDAPGPPHGALRRKDCELDASPSVRAGWSDV
jgi:hypothetical protein